ncbi:hypothetical protein B0H19DRAFT_1143066 [Mycena capillaripes]|nr:hypothetical protein B0H19DRAFT_1143066 [Mycena capillaripes]
MTLPTTMSSAKPAKFKTPTCALCRRRKLRCDGGNPCGPCSRTRTPVTCTYVPKTVGQLRSELPKGGACITCRQRKRRCDGNLPCRTCTQTSRPDECQYREKGRGSHTRPKPPPRDDRFSPDSSSASSSSRPTTPSQLASQESGMLRLPNECLDIPLPDPSDPLLSWSEFNPMCHPADSSCSPESLFCLPSLDSVPLSPSTLEVDPLIQERRERFMAKFMVRNLFMEHRWQYGLSLITAKREALSMGDLSGLSVDPTLVHVSELMGYVVKLHSHPEVWLPFNGQTTAEAELEFLIRNRLENASGLKSDLLLCLQAYTLLALYSAQKEDIRSCQGYLRKASDMIVLHAATLGLHAPASFWCPKFDASYLSPHSVEDEARAAFSQMVYLDLECILVLNLPSIIDPELVEKFRRLTAVHLGDTELNFLRAKGSLYLSDSQQLAAAWNRREFGDPAPTAWSKRYWSLIEDTHSHINFLNTALMDVSWIPALQGALPTLKTCVITSLAALAELYGLFAPSRPELRQKHREVVTEIGNISRGFSDKDYDYLDPILGVCWSIACRTLYNASEPEMHSYRPLFQECNRKLRRASPFVTPL